MTFVYMHGTYIVAEQVTRIEEAHVSTQDSPQTAIHLTDGECLIVDGHFHAVMDLFRDATHA